MVKVKCAVCPTSDFLELAKHDNADHLVVWHKGRSVYLTRDSARKLAQILGDWSGNARELVTGTL